NRLPLPALLPLLTPQFAQPQFQPGTARYGEDIVATNVLSFQVMVWYEPMTFNATQFPRPYTLNNTDAPYDYLATGVFDTAAPAGAPGFTQSRVRGLQITLRIADLRVGIARSNTLKFAM
ncbi:MAG TPA: hypothetical protein VLM40_09250, partial [Gemmata sp.]|nr:hypothetical protein [Gemmata sp.]